MDIYSISVIIKSGRFELRLKKKKKEVVKEMTTHSSVLAWIIPGTGEPGGLPSLGSHRVGDN